MNPTAFLFWTGVKSDVTYRTPSALNSNKGMFKQAVSFGYPYATLNGLPEATPLLLERLAKS